LPELIFEIIFGLGDLPLRRGEGKGKRKKGKASHEGTHGQLRY